MNHTPSLPRLRLISDDDLEREFTAAGHDEATRQAILFERLRRIKPQRSNGGLQWAILVVSLIGAILAGIGAFPTISGMFEREWFDF
jgi:hypothetical protein